jgi:hypothetical protein
MLFAKALLLLLCTPYAVHCINVQSGSDLTGTQDQKALQLAEEICGRGITIIDAKFEACEEDDQYGLFTDANLQFGPDFNNGIVLSSGFAKDVVGANNNLYNGLDVLNHPGFAPLNYLLPFGRQTQDACVLHITFDCQDHAHFGMEFVFGSDNYVCPASAFKPATNPFEDVMGIFAKDNKKNGKNLGIYNNKYISVNTVNAQSNAAIFFDNCPATQQVEMNGYTYPIKIDNTAGQIVKGTNHLWIAVADGYDPANPTSSDMKKPAWLFVRRNSLVCIDKASRTSPGGNVRTGYRKCASDALDGCSCGDWGCLDQHIQTRCVHPGNTQDDHHMYKQNVHAAIRNICNHT